MDPLAFLDEFRAEAADHLRSLDAQLLRLERNPAEVHLIREMFRSAHTIKGGAALLGLSDVLELAHAVEDVLGGVRDSVHPIDAETLELLFQAIDALRDVAAVARPGVASAHERRSALMESLRRHAEAPRATEPVQAHASAARLRALVVDESATVRLLSTMHLSAAGFRVDAVADGQQALAEARATTYDLVVTAIETAGLSGPELATTLRGKPDYQDVPIVLTSSDERAEYRQHVAELGLHAYLPKGSFSDRRLVELGESIFKARMATVAGEHAQKILVVDDSALHQHVTRELLESLGYSVDVADNGRHALQVLDGGAYAMVLMDCQMPEMGGFEVSRAIRQREGGGPRIPIVAMTADTSVADRERCFAAGMSDYLPKPVQKDELAACLKAWLQPTAVGQRPPALDTETLDGLRALSRPGQPDRVEPLIRLFRAEGRARVADCREAIERDDAKALGAAAHALKGASGTFGAPELHRVAAELERRAHKDIAGGGSDIVAELERAFERVERALEEYVACGPTGSHE